MIPRLKPETTLLLIVDVQTKLLPVMDHAGQVERNCAILAGAARLFGLPIVVSEQNPTRIGPTVDGIREALGAFEPIAKMRFSAWPDARSAIESANRHNILLCGLEGHVCVLQTGLDLIDAGYTVWLVEDAISSRHEANRRVGCKRLESAGAIPTSTESAVFELMQSAKHADFKAILALIK